MLIPTERQCHRPLKQSVPSAEFKTLVLNEKHNAILNVHELDVVLSPIISSVNL